MINKNKNKRGEYIGLSGFRYFCVVSTTVIETLLCTLVIRDQNNSKTHKYL